MRYKVQLTDERGNVQHYTIKRNYVYEKKSLDDFLFGALQISDDNRKLPLIIQCPDGPEVYPSIKIKFTNLGDKAEALRITG